MGCAPSARPVNKISNASYNYDFTNYDPTKRRTPTPPPKPDTPPPTEPIPARRQHHDPYPPPCDPTPPQPEHHDPTPPQPEHHDPTPSEPEHQIHRRQPGGEHGGAQEYIQNEHDIHEAKYDFRQCPTDLVFDFGTPPTQLPYTDHEFDRNVNAKGRPVEWKRPGEFRGNPVLFSDGTTRYDIGQGSVGTCWFLSTLAMLADRPKLFHRVVPEDAWNKEGGYFHCRFWRFGEWEDVFIDDFIPVCHNGAEYIPWGAKSKDNPDEMWPSLVEKAFARFHGGYDDASSGVCGDAFLALTGGCAEITDFDKELVADSQGNKGQKTLELHNRIKNAINGGSMLTTSVPSQYNGHCGLVGGHAYSLTGACSVQDNSGRDVHLVRVRNPWGHQEWEGRWADGSQEWQSIDPSALSNITKDDGEFWVCIEDFVTYFSSVTICAMTPDFDKDGATDTLNHCTFIYGDWLGPTAAGFKNRLDCPRYVFHVDDTGIDTDGRVPLVIQICQKMLHRKDAKAAIRIDLCKVNGDQANCPKSALQWIGDGSNVIMYKIARQMTMRRKIEPGYYVAVPSSQHAGTEKEFIVRIFSPGALSEVSQHNLV